VKSLPAKPWRKSVSLLAQDGSFITQTDRCCLARLQQNGSRNRQREMLKPAGRRCGRCNGQFEFFNLFQRMNLSKLPNSLSAYPPIIYFFRIAFKQFAYFNVYKISVSLFILSLPMWIALPYSQEKDKI
jgi:hypothetical protein